MTISELPLAKNEAPPSITNFSIMSQANEIVCNPGILGGKPVVAGTRISVELILEKLAAGRTIEELLVGHPNLTAAGIQAALNYALQTLRNEEVYPLAG